MGLQYRAVSPRWQRYQLTDLEMQIESLKQTNNNKIEQVKKAAPLLANLKAVYDKCDIRGKHKLVKAEF